MTTRLQLYNDALMICGERRLASLTEDREPRHLLDLVWDNDGVGACLEKGQWKFAIRATQIDYDPSVTPEWGYSRAFLKPTDWKLTSAVCSDEFFTEPLTRYEDEAGYWYAELDTMYVKYVSDDSAYGSDLSLWPQSFADYAAAYFARRIILTLTADENKRQEVFEYEKQQLKYARNSDAMAGPTKFPASGSWVKSRYTRDRERGNRGSLIG